MIHVIGDPGSVPWLLRSERAGVVIPGPARPSSCERWGQTVFAGIDAAGGGAAGVEDGTRMEVWSDDPVFFESFVTFPIWQRTAVDADRDVSADEVPESPATDWATRACAGKVRGSITWRRFCRIPLHACVSTDVIGRRTRVRDRRRAAAARARDGCDRGPRRVVMRSRLRCGESRGAG
jgi:hypothetical protein